jgi:cyclopropane fatty-acyl-phospholipid synthase-like methyltransferase
MMKKRSAIGHFGLPFNCPHNDDMANIILEKICSSHPAVRIADLGCGRGEILCRAVEMSGEQCVGVAIDSDPAMLSQIRTPINGSIVTAESDREIWISTELEKQSKYDAIICIGSLSSQKQSRMISDLSKLITPNGWLVIGELVWIVPEPGEEFITFSGIQEGDYMNMDALQNCMELCGFSIRYSTSQRLEEYERNLLANVEKWGELNSTDPDRDKILEGSRSWNDFGASCAWDTWHFATVVGQKGFDS